MVEILQAAEEVAEPILMADSFFMPMVFSSPYMEVRKILVDKFTVLCLNAYDQIISARQITDAGQEMLTTGQEVVKTANTASYHATQGGKVLLKATSSNVA